MDEGQVNAVEQTEAPVTESAPVEVSTEDNLEASEKTEITEEVNQDSSEVVGPRSGKEIPYDRFAEKVKETNELKARLEALERERQEQERLANMGPDEVAKEQQLKQAKEALKKLGFTTQEDIERMKESEKARNMFISEMNRLESTHNGKDGLPKFVPVEVAKYMDELAMKGQHITDPETAYKLMHLDVIAEAKAKRQKSTTFSENQSGGIQEVNDERNADLKAARDSGSWETFLSKYAPYSGE